MNIELTLEQPHVDSQVVREHERAVIFRLGHLLRGKPRGPGRPRFHSYFYLYFIFIYLWKDQHARSGGSKGVNLNTWALPFKATGSAQEKWRRESGRWIGPWLEDRSETMALTRRQEAELRMLRFSLGATRKDKIRNVCFQTAACVRVDNVL